MKKSRFGALLVLGTTLLTSCDLLDNLNSLIPSVGTSGSTDSSVGVKVNEGGVEAPFSDGLVETADALERTLAQESLGFSVSVPSLTTQSTVVTYTNDVNACSGDDNQSTATASFLYKDFALTNLTANVAVTGLGSVDGEALLGSLNLAAESATSSVKHVDLQNQPIGDDNGDNQYADLSGAVYLKGHDLYLDASNPSLRGVLGYLGSWLDHSLSLSEKTLFQDALGNLASPVVTMRGLSDSLSSVMAIMQANPDLFTRYFSVTNYDDGTSLFHGTIGSNALIKMASLFESAFTGSTYDATYARLLNQYGSSSMQLALGLSFDATGLRQIQINGNGLLVSNPSVEVVAISDTVTRNITTVETFRFSGGLVADLVYGDNVAVTIPEDLSAYEIYA